MLTALSTESFPRRSASRSSLPRIPPRKASSSPVGIRKSESWAPRMFPSTLSSPPAKSPTRLRLTSWMSTALTAQLMSRSFLPLPARPSPSIPRLARASRSPLTASSPAQSQLTAALFSRFTTAVISISLRLTVQSPWFTTVLNSTSQSPPRITTPSQVGTSKFLPPCPHPT